MRKFFLLLFIFLFFIPPKAYAIYDPFSKPNNYLGIHILFTSELEKASVLLNSSGGDWGYVTIPIQIGDRDIDKWQSFMNNAYDKHLIPIIRLSTEADYMNTGFWRKPTEADVLDFANFLNSLYWPTKNRYVILFNEVNRYDEWGGDNPDPEEYASLVNYAIDVFKSRSTDFFIILGGLDNASPNDGVKYLDNFIYLTRMSEKDSSLFNKIDGFASHSYPNPDFLQSPTLTGQESVATYRFEQKLVDSYTSAPKPFFITETGWNGAKLSEGQIASYFKLALDDVWGKDLNSIVAITPFLLESQNGAFDKFTFTKSGTLTEYGKTYQSYPKIKGIPELNPPPPPLKKKEMVLGIQDFKGKFKNLLIVPQFPSVLKFYFKSILGLK